MESNNDFIKKIFFSYENVMKYLYAYLNDGKKTSKLTINLFKKVCEIHGVDKHPTILYEFLELNDIRIGVAPNEKRLEYMTDTILDEYLEYYEE